MLALGNFLRFHFKKLTLKFCRFDCPPFLELMLFCLHQKLLVRRVIHERKRDNYLFRKYVSSTCCLEGPRGRGSPFH